MPGTGAHQGITDLLNAALGDIGRPSEQDEQFDGSRDGNKHRRRGVCALLDTVVLIVDHLQQRMVIHDRMHAGAEPIRVTE